MVTIPMRVNGFRSLSFSCETVYHFAPPPPFFFVSPPQALPLIRSNTKFTQSLSILPFLFKSPPPIFWLTRFSSFFKSSLVITSYWLPPMAHIPHPFIPSWSHLKLTWSTSVPNTCFVVYSHACLFRPELMPLRLWHLVSWFHPLQVHFAYKMSRQFL